MLHIFQLAQAKKTARALEKALSATGITLKHGKALDVLSSMAGFLDWNAYSKTIDETSINETLHDFELSHLKDAGDVSYGEEVALVAHTGFELRYSATTELCDYVRVCDPLGRELMYWHADEWREDAECVMGAILGALVRGTPAEVSEKSSSKAAAPVASAPRVPLISDVDFLKASEVIFNDTCYAVLWREEEVLAKLQSNPAQADDDSGEEQALMLQRNEDGLIYDESLSLDQLRTLKWDSNERCFSSEELGTVKFFYSVDFADAYGG